MSNTNEESMFPRGMSPEEAALLSDLEIIKLLIAEKRQKMSMHDANRRAAIRRRR